MIVHFVWALIGQDTGQIMHDPKLIFGPFGSAFACASHGIAV